MKIQILYEARYAYPEAVSFSPHIFRLFPRAERHVRVLSADFSTNADVQVSFRRDIFDNEIASCFYPEQSRLLQANFTTELLIEEKNAFDFLVAPHALDLHFAYQSAERRVLSPYLENARRIELPFWKVPAQARGLVETLKELNGALHANIGYERREEGEALAPEELLRCGAGSCRDFAVLLAEVLRGLGIATRLASGYLCEFGSGDKIAEGALHAWTEAYIPGAGWIGMDPTNGTFCDHHHLIAAVGLGAEDIAPVLGNYYSEQHLPAQMSASLRIIPLAGG